MLDLNPSISLMLDSYLVTQSIIFGENVCNSGQSTVIDTALVVATMCDPAPPMALMHESVESPRFDVSLAGLTFNASCVLRHWKMRWRVILAQTLAFVVRLSLAFCFAFLCFNGVCCTSRMG